MHQSLLLDDSLYCVVISSPWTVLGLLTTTSICTFIAHPDDILVHDILDLGHIEFM